MNSTNKKENITDKFLAEQSAQLDENTSELIEYYSNVADIVERTYVAMGRKAVYKSSTKSTLNSELNVGTISTTSQI